MNSNPMHYLSGEMLLCFSLSTWDWRILCFIVWGLSVYISIVRNINTSYSVGLTSYQLHIPLLSSASRLRLKVSSMILCRRSQNATGNILKKTSADSQNWLVMVLGSRALWGNCAAIISDLFSKSEQSACSIFMRVFLANAIAEQHFYGRTTVEYKIDTSFYNFICPNSRDICLSITVSSKESQHVALLDKFKCISVNKCALIDKLA